MKKTAALLTLILVILSALPISANAIEVSSDGKWLYTDYKMPGYSEGYMIIGYRGEDASVILPESIDGHPINSASLLNDEKIVKLSIPQCYTFFGTSAFGYCKKLQTVMFSREYVENEITYFGSIMFAGSKKLKKVVLPNKLPRELHYSRAADAEYEAVVLPDGTFQDCKSLIDVVMPDNLTEIENCCFENCLSLRELIIPEGVKYLNDGIFDGCTSLRTVGVPSTIEGISSDGIIPKSSTVILESNSDYVESYIENQPKAYYVGLIIDKPSVYVKGDINGDGEMNICDATLIQCYLVRKLHYDISEKADLNGDGKVNIDDVTYIQISLAMLEPIKDDGTAL